MPRHDRKYLTSLELHRAIADALIETPIFVFVHGLYGAKKVRPHAHGGALNLIDEWERLIAARDIEGLRVVLLGEDEHSAEMRNATVFLGVLSETERRAALDRAYAHLQEQ